jgi:hypothetical protein
VVEPISTPSQETEEDPTLTNEELQTILYTLKIVKDNGIEGLENLSPNANEDIAPLLWGDDPILQLSEDQVQLNPTIQTEIEKLAETNPLALEILETVETLKATPQKQEEPSLPEAPAATAKEPKPEAEPKPKDDGKTLIEFFNAVLGKKRLPPSQWFAVSAKVKPLIDKNGGLTREAWKTYGKNPVIATLAKAHKDKTQAQTIN